MWHWFQHTDPWLASQHSKTKATKKGRLHKQGKCDSFKPFPLLNSCTMRQCVRLFYWHLFHHLPIVPLNHVVFNDISVTEAGIFSSRTGIQHLRAIVLIWPEDWLPYFFTDIFGHAFVYVFVSCLCSISKDKNMKTEQLGKSVRTTTTSPSRVSFVKSRGVPWTPITRPVGIRAASTSV